MSRIIRLPFFDIEIGQPNVSFDGSCGIHCGQGSHHIGGSRLLNNDRYELRKDPGIHCGKGCCHGRRPLGHPREREGRPQKRKWWQS